MIIVISRQSRLLPKRVEMNFIRIEGHLLNMAHIVLVSAVMNQSFIYMANGAELLISLPIADVQARIAAAYAAGPGVH